MAKTSLEIQPLITEVPLTAEAREKFINQLFMDELPHQGEVFVPDDDFYRGSTAPKKAAHMVKMLCRWLGIKPGYINLELESGGTEVPDGSHYTIYVETSVLKDEFILGAYLAHALTRYLVEERKQVHLPETDQQAALLAGASVIFGLGPVIMNGLNPAYSWASDLRPSGHLLKNFPLSSYSHMTRNFLRKYRIDQASYLHSLTPWAVRRLGLPPSRHPSHAVRDARHSRRVANSKLAGVCWVVVLVIGISGFVFVQRVRPQSAETIEASQKVLLLHELTRVCADQLAYERQYADISDIQTVRALNAEALRCKSLQNHYEAAQRRLEDQTN